MLNNYPDIDLINQKIHVVIIYPADPAGVIPGGVDTYIRGLIRTAPDDIQVSLIGVTTNPTARPVGKWCKCDLGGKVFSFFPVAWEKKPGQRGRIPLSIRFMLGLLRYRPKFNADVLEFHRIEPVLLYLFNRKPKNVFVHQNMQILENPNADILWSKLPWLYYQLEKFIYHKISSVFVVCEDAVTWYRSRFPEISDRFEFIPTWMDPEVFYVPTNEQADHSARHIQHELGLKPTTSIVITVGRLDDQKQPLLLASAFRELLKTHPDTCLVYIGDGKLRGKLEEYIDEHKLTQAIKLVGLKSQPEIVQYLWAANLFALSSAYEGMPMCVLEALGTGCPVVSTSVGEVSRVVILNKSGLLVSPGDERSFTNALAEALDINWESNQVYRAVTNYIPKKVLAPVYAKYRLLSQQQN